MANNNIDYASLTDQIYLGVVKDKTYTHMVLDTDGYSYNKSINKLSSYKKYNVCVGMGTYTANYINELLRQFKILDSPDELLIHRQFLEYLIEKIITLQIEIRTGLTKCSRGDHPFAKKPKLDNLFPQTFEESNEQRCNTQ